MPESSTPPPPPPPPPRPDEEHPPERWGRVRIEATPAVLATLRACAACATAPVDVRAAATAAVAASERQAEGQGAAASAPSPPGVPWRLVQRACECCTSGSSGEAARHVRDLLSTPGPTAAAAARLLLPSPPPPKPRPPELAARLQRFKEMLEDQRYAAALKDASPAEAAEVLRQMRRRHRRREEGGGDLNDDDDDDAPNLLPTTRLQLSFGLQVIVTMGAFFALGYYGGMRATGGSVAAGALLGTFGLVAALLLETTLFVVRSSPRLRALDKKYGHLMAKRKKNEEEERVDRGGGGGGGGAEATIAADERSAAATGVTTAAAAPSSSLRQRRRPA